MKISLQSGIVVQDNYEHAQVSLNSLKIGGPDIDTFSFANAKKEVFQLDQTSGAAFNKDLLVDIDPTKIALLLIDIYDISNDSFNNTVPRFKLEIDALNLGQLSQFNITNPESGINATSIIITNIALEVDQKVNLVIFTAFKNS